MPFTEEEKRERKNARQREYARRTGYMSNNKYNKEHSVSFAFKLYDTKDGAIIDYLNAIPNKASYLKELVKKDMRENGIEFEDNV